jgi:hypothetical protein
MVGSTIDHLVAITLFLAAMLIFISLFNQTIQTAILYQHHRYLATKCSDLLDNILLSPGSPSNETFHWGKSNCTPTSFGLQDPEFTEYRLSPFSLMRLNSATGTPVYYPETGLYYSNITVGFGKFLLVPFNEVVNYSTAQTLLGINNTYGFQLTVMPIVTVSITEVQPKNPLRLALNVKGTGFPLSDANISYCLITVEAAGDFPAYTVDYNTTFTNSEGSTVLDFPDVDGTRESYVLIAYAHLCGLVGVGYHEHVTHDSSYVIPFISNLGLPSDKKEIIIAHSYDVQGRGDSAAITYNATFVLLTEDFTLREMPMENSTGNINSGEHSSHTITIRTDNPGILVITYKKSASECGVVLMPWGISSLAFSVTFGENLLYGASKEWVATDIRIVIVNDVAYQAKLALWSLESYPVVSELR